MWRDIKAMHVLHPNQLGALLAACQLVYTGLKPVDGVTMMSPFVLWTVLLKKQIQQYGRPILVGGVEGRWRLGGYTLLPMTEGPSRQLEAAVTQTSHTLN